MCLASADGPVSTDKPTAAPDLRLILGGKFIENSETLNGASVLSLLTSLLLSSAQLRRNMQCNVGRLCWSTPAPDFLTSPLSLYTIGMHEVQGP